MIVRQSRIRSTTAKTSTFVISYDTEQETLLMTAASSGNLEIVKLLVERKASVNRADVYGSTALVKVALHGHADVAAFLLDSHADVNARGAENWTALHYAALWDHVALAKLLLERQADALIVVEDTPRNSPRHGYCRAK